MPSFKYTTRHASEAEGEPVVYVPDVLSVLEPQEPPQQEPHADEDNSAPPDGDTGDLHSDDDVEGDCPEPAETSTADGSATPTTPLCRQASELLAPRR